MTNAERQRKYRGRRNAERNELVKIVTDKMEGVTGVTEWDNERFPEKEAWKIAVARAERARRYALALPDFVHPGDEKYQDIGWQYEHEGLPAIKKPETHTPQ